MSEKMSVAEIVTSIHERLIAMGVDVGDENAIMAGVEALQREADGLRGALKTARWYVAFYEAAKHREGRENRPTDYENTTHLSAIDAALNGSPQAPVLEDKQ